MSFTGPPPPPPPRRSRRGLWVALAAGALALVLTGVGAVFALTTYLGSLDSTGGESGSEIEVMLAEHTRALTERDLAAFLAPIDPANKKLIAQQTALFHNLTKLPLAEARYEEFGATPDPVGTFDVRVAFAHRFERMDPTSVQQLYKWTISRPTADDPLRVTAVGGAFDTGPTRDLTTYYPAPWDLGRPLHVEQTPHTVLIADESLAGVARRYAPLAERAATENLAAWRDGGVTAKIADGFVISLVKGKKELGSLYRTTKETPIASGVAIPVPPTGGIDGSDSSLPDVGTSRVVIDTNDAYHSKSRTRQLELLRHELAHAIVIVLHERDSATLAIDGPEKWVVEGFAEYLAHDRTPFTTSDRTAESLDILRSYDYREQLPGNVGWESEGRMSYHYWLGHSAMSYLAEKYGGRKVFELVATHYRNVPINRALQQVVGVSYAEFEAGWSGYLRSAVT